MNYANLTLAALCTVALSVGTPAMAQSLESQTVVQATGVLNEIMQIPAKGIPHKMLADAQGLVIIPNMIKGGFVVGVRHGNGVVMVRDANTGGWTAPQFVSMTGGSVGWQVGVQSTDVILVFRTQKSVQGLLQGKFTLGVDAAAAAGPVGRQASAGTDLELKSEIYSYNRSRGLFIGASLDGSALQMNQAATQAYYANGVPPEANELVATVLRYSAPVPAGMTVVGEQQPQMQLSGPSPAVETVGQASEHLNQLQAETASASQRLAAVLDDNWRRYLALPAEVYTPGRQPSPQALASSLENFRRVMANPEYAQLSQRADFRSLVALLEQYAAALAQPVADNGLQLPPPPM
ncbi:lipid-binding SYLF domain-containing protein [Blastopirellula sp. JC732]|uniref:Lipid-binding SYLF domain-containing protein n=1 Tax=Blastopirellula sediminis TaxID=2894196 RepID=A0A9X1SKG7_9BACT|nr:lipid-binding SYLF domain-containing protein [Blastopirellula sediminis]MCC9606976.1 lipid-binding SYLF domain-containing protein [Blastopirellula sediminis]MCC9629729.1 lipid-binding SYLF domain-containing protein [Blastopirellula sediminis]